MKLVFLKLLALLALALLASAALADPPGRVGRIAYVQGAVDFRATYDGAPTPALQNWPLTSYNVISTGPGARAELSVGPSAIRLDSESELEIAILDDTHFRLRLLQGSLNARISGPDLVQDFELATAQGRLSLAAPSQLHVDAGRSPGLTVVDIFTGAGRFDGAQSTLTLQAGQRADVTDRDTRVGAAVRDDFDFWSLARDQRDSRALSARYVSPDMTGYEDLDQYGSWSTTDDYGPVWYPNAVPADWAPYQSGSWTWIEPWGWTWVDSAPWGYAPFHYGRWAWFRSRWCWVPGRVVARPIWAPALVGWVGGGNWSATFSVGRAPAVGWFPLAPHEVFRPSFASSPTFIRQINVTQVTNVNNINPAPPANFQNRFVRNALTVVPHARFEGHRTVAVANVPALVGSQQLSSAPLSAVVPSVIARPAPAVPRFNNNEQRRNGPRPEAQRQQSLATPAAPVAPLAPNAPPVRSMHEAPPAALPTQPLPRHEERGQNRNETRPLPEQRPPQGFSHDRQSSVAPATPTTPITLGAPPAHQFAPPAEQRGQRFEPPTQPTMPARPMREAQPAAPPAALPTQPLPRHEERTPNRTETRPMPEQRQAFPRDRQSSVAPAAPVTPITPRASPAHQFAPAPEQRIQRFEPPTQPMMPARPMREAPPAAPAAPTFQRHEERAEPQARRDGGGGGHDNQPQRNER